MCHNRIPANTPIHHPNNWSPTICSFSIGRTTENLRFSVYSQRSIFVRTLVYIWPMARFASDIGVSCTTEHQRLAFSNMLYPINLCSILHSEAMKFRYPRFMFAIRAIALLTVLACLIYLMNNAELQSTWLFGFVLIFVLAIIITLITPMFTQHEINTDGILLKQGLVFKASFQFLHIETVEIYSIKPGIFGLTPARNRIVLASGNKGLVKIKFDHKRRFGMLLLRQADEIIIDLEKPEEFVKLASEKLNSQ